MYISGVNHNGGVFVTHTLHERHTRDVHESEAWFYAMDAFGNKMHLKLTRKTHLVKPSLEFEMRYENGQAKLHFFTGKRS